MTVETAGLEAVPDHLREEVVLIERETKITDGAHDPEAQGTILIVTCPPHREGETTTTVTVHEKEKKSATAPGIESATVTVTVTVIETDTATMTATPNVAVRAIMMTVNDPATRRSTATFPATVVLLNAVRRPWAQVLEPAAGVNDRDREAGNGTIGEHSCMSTGWLQQSNCLTTTF